MRLRICIPSLGQLFFLLRLNDALSNLHGHPDHSPELWSLVSPGNLVLNQILQPYPTFLTTPRPCLSLPVMIGDTALCPVTLAAP